LLPLLFQQLNALIISKAKLSLKDKDYSALSEDASTTIGQNNLLLCSYCRTHNTHEGNNQTHFLHLHNNNGHCCAYWIYLIVLGLDVFNQYRLFLLSKPFNLCGNRCMILCIVANYFAQKNQK